MIVVSDTSPLNYLILVRQEAVLPALFKDLLTTPEVLEEMRSVHAPKAVRSWAENPPAWLLVQSARFIDPSLQLGKGESSAICLAVELQNNRSDVTILIDERDGREAARGRGLRIAGTLTVLSEAARAGLLDLPQVIDDLRATSFYVKPAILDDVLRIDRERKIADAASRKQEGLGSGEGR